MPAVVIERVNQIGKNEPSILTFTNRHGQEIGNTTQDFDPGKMTILILNPLLMKLQEWSNLMTMMNLQEWTSMPSPQEWRMNLIMVTYMSQFSKASRDVPR